MVNSQTISNLLLPKHAELLFGRSCSLFQLDNSTWQPIGHGSIAIFRDPSFVNIGLWDASKKILTNIIDTSCDMKKSSKRKFYLQIKGLCFVAAFEKEGDDKISFKLMEMIFSEALFINQLGIQDEVKSNRKNPTESLKKKVPVPLIGMEESNSFEPSVDKLDGCEIKKPKIAVEIQKLIPFMEIPKSEDSSSEDENDDFPMCGSGAQVKDLPKMDLEPVVTPIPAGLESDESSTGQMIPKEDVEPKVPMECNVDDAKSDDMALALMTYIDDVEARLLRKIETLEYALNVKESENIELKSEMSDMNQKMKMLSQLLDELLDGKKSEEDKLEKNERMIQEMSERINNLEMFQKVFKNAFSQ